MTEMKVLFGLLFVIFAGNCAFGAPQCTGIEDNEKFDCFPENIASIQKCLQRGCCWSAEHISIRPPDGSSPPLDIPWCFYPKNFKRYEYINFTETEDGSVAHLKKVRESTYPNDIDNLKMEIQNYTDDIVRIKITDADKPRYESLYPELANMTGAENPNYNVHIDMDKAGFKVSRANGEVLFNCKHLSIYSDQFIQISAAFRGRIYGLGEHRTSFSLSTNWTRFTLWSHDSPPMEGVNLYGTHPFYMVVEPNGNSHGVYLRNSNAMDVLLQPLPAITFRTLGGVLDFFFFMGPTPGDVIRQYTGLIGRPFLPPYWALGFHLSRWGYWTDKETRTAWERNRDFNIPFESQWSDIDYMKSRNGFTIHPKNYRNLHHLVNDIHRAGMYFVPIIDPGVSASETPGSYPPYDDGLKMDIFVKNDNGGIFVGRVWNPDTTVFPDFTHPKIYDYWAKQLREFREKIDFDGLWLDMNEPSNFFNGGFKGCPNNSFENPPYVPKVEGNKLYYRTICMSAKQHAGIHYNLHNLYGITETVVTYKILEELIGKRPFILTRSTSPGSGKYAAHWTGDNISSWSDMRKSIPAILSFSLFGIPLTGADICGYMKDTTPSLCNRWTQLGAFYPFSRNHNGNYPDQDPPMLGDEVVNNTIKVLSIRYSLLPYLYTLFYRAHVYGDTVARPVLFEFPEDEKTHELDTTFFWGSGLYIIPVLEYDALEVKAYLPAGRWYDWYTLRKRDSKGEEVTFEADFDRIPLMIRGGTILPTQAPDVTTKRSRQNNFTLIVAPDKDGSASGELFWDDGASVSTIENKQYGLLDFTFTRRNFTSRVNVWNAVETPILEVIKVVGVDNVTKVILNGQEKGFEFNASVLTVPDINLPLNTDIHLSWA